MTEDLADASAALDRGGFVILDRRLEQAAVTDARNEIEGLLAKTSWGSGFDGDRTRRVWALLAKSRCMDDAALDSLVLALADHAIGPGAQFSLTQATQIHPGQAAQPLHYEQGIYPIPRDGDVKPRCKRGPTCQPHSHVDRNASRLGARLSRQALARWWIQHQQQPKAGRHHRLRTTVAAPLRSARSHRRPGKRARPTTATPRTPWL